jgi:hypothetical protein
MIWKIIDLAAGLPIVCLPFNMEPMAKLRAKEDYYTLVYGACAGWFETDREPRIYNLNLPNEKGMWLSTYCTKVALRAAMEVIMELQQPQKCSFEVAQNYTTNPVVMGILQEKRQFVGRSLVDTITFRNGSLIQGLPKGEDLRAETGAWIKLTEG